MADYRLARPQPAASPPARAPARQQAQSSPRCAPDQSSSRSPGPRPLRPRPPHQQAPPQRRAPRRRRPAPRPHAASVQLRPAVGRALARQLPQASHRPSAEHGSQALGQGLHRAGSPRSPTAGHRLPEPPQTCARTPYADPWRGARGCSAPASWRGGSPRARPSGRGPLRWSSASGSWSGRARAARARGPPSSAGCALQLHR